MKGRISDEGMEQRLAEMRAVARDFGEWEGKRIRLDEFLKARRSQLMKDAQKAGHTTAAAQEREAMAHPDYAQIIEGLGEATREATRLKWELKIFELGVSIWQTRQANWRAEHKGYSNT